MKKIARLALAYVFLGFACLHGLAVILLVLPENAFTQSYKEPVSNYALPFFPQVWLLFGPQFHGAESKFYYRCMQTNGEWTAWQDPLEGILTASQNNRISSNGYLYRTVDSLRMEVHNALYQLREKENCGAKDRVCQQKIKDQMAKNAYYQSLTRIIGESCTSAMGEQNWTQADFQFAWIHTKAVKDTSQLSPEDIESEYFEPFKNPSLARDAPASTH